MARLTGRLSDRINIGAADIFFTPQDTNLSLYLGLTQDGATFKYEPEWHDIMADQYGNMLLDAILIGEVCSCEVNILDTAKDHIYDVMATNAKISKGDKVEAVTFGQRPGLRASRHCGILRIHPISMGIGNLSNDIIIYQCFNKAGLELAFKKDAEWIIPCNWVGLVDLNRPNGDLLFRIGDYSGELPDDEGGNGAAGIPVDFTIAPLNPSSSVGGTVEFTANALFQDYSRRDVTANARWFSSDEDVVTISVVGNKAVATGVKSGVAIIAADYIGFTVNTTITIA